MESDYLSLIYKKENLRLIRRHLGMTQKEFISRFLVNEKEEPLISVATLSNLESKGGVRLNETLIAVAEKLTIDPMVFAMEPEEFAGKIDILLPGSAKEKELGKKNMKKGGINQLINQLTLYFAEQMFENRLKKGDKIESDRELAVRLNVGRSAIREAMKVLDVLGMVDIRPGQGTFIRSNEADFFIIPLSWSLFLNGNQTDSIITVRNVLEVKAAELAADCQDEELLGRLSEISHNMQEAYIKGSRKEFLEGDMAFHICLAECSGNRVIYSMIQTISNLMRHVSGSGMINEEQIRAINEEHQRIYGCILTHDAVEAKQAMEDHLSKSKKRYSYR